jgi:hypothetical protein
MAEDKKLIAPYVEWAVLTNFVYLPGDWFRVLLELEGSAVRFASEMKKFKEQIKVPPIYETVPRGFDETGITFCTAIMTRTALAALVLDRGDDGFVAEFKKAIKRIELGPSTPEFSDSPANPVGPPTTTPPPTSIVAVIDDGLAFAHERFRVGANTRFKYFWNQDDSNIAGIDLPAGFGSGREFTETKINKLLGDHTHNGLVDEDALYREAGQKLVARRIKHGTHVMDIACGPDPKDSTYQPPYLIGVQLPKSITEDTSGALLTPAVYDAIRYIIHRASLIAAAEHTALFPIVVNISYGTIAGPHDGTGVFEAAIDQLIAGRPTPLRVVLPAGNHYLARCHARFCMKPGTPDDPSCQELNWRIQPDNKANSFVEIWLPEAAVDGTRPHVSVQLTTPRGEVTPWVDPGHQFPLPTSFPPPTPLKTEFLVQNFDPAGERPRIVLSVAATAAPDPGPPIAPSGTWIIKIKNETAAEFMADAWVQRGDTPLGYPLWGRQSRFDDENYQRFDLAGRPWQEDSDPSYIRRHGSINALATGPRTIVVGGFRRSDRTPSEYSGAGPVATHATPPPSLIGPDAAAVADDSPVLGGVLAAGTRSGSAVAIRGTSVAAPQVTRLIAEWMAEGLVNDRAAVQFFAATHDPNPPPMASALEQRLGKGRIERPEPVQLRLKGR